MKIKYVSFFYKLHHMVECYRFRHNADYFYLLNFIFIFNFKKKLGPPPLFFFVYSTIYSMIYSMISGLVFLFRNTFQK